MASHEEGPAAGRPLDAERGRRASAAELRERLPQAPPAYLEGAWENPELGKEALALLLRNRAAPAALLSRVAGDRRFAMLQEVRLALVVHPRTPQPLAQSLASHLRWKELCEVADDVRVPPPVRRKAEDLLRVRLEELAVGERIALARRASRGVIAALRQDPDGRVLEALLGNPKLLEAEAAALARSGSTPPAALAALSGHPRWGGRRAVRLALARNARTPVRSALRALEGLSRSDLLRLVRDDEAPRIVRVVAERTLGAGAPGDRTPEG